MQMEKLGNEIKENDEFIQNDINEEDSLSILDNSDNSEFEYNEENKNNITSNIKRDIFKKFKVYFFFEYDKNFQFVFPIETDFFNIEKQYIYELIKNVVKIINNNKFIINYKSINYLVSLKDCENSDSNFYINNYEIRPCKKNNFLPKTDLPHYSSNSLLKNINNETISFISKNTLNIMLFEKYDVEIENKIKNKYNNNIIKNINNNNSKNRYKKNSCKNSCLIF